MTLKILFLVFTVFSTQISAICRNDCKDLSTMCGMMHSKCNPFNNLMEMYCPLTCGYCKSCDTLYQSNIMHRIPQNIPCEVGTCRDKASFTLCLIYRRKSWGCTVMGGMCRATCGLCRGCLLPPPCEPNCIDAHENCKFWRKRGYCNAKNGYPHTRNVCRLSCSVCAPCPTKPPNTALPPGPEN